MSATVDKYQQMLDLADRFDVAGRELRVRAGLGEELLDDPALIRAASVSPATSDAIRTAVRAAMTKALTTAVELDADATVVRATVLTYRWIDDLQETARQTLGDLAGRSVGYLAPEVDLGSSIVSAGLIEIDPADRDQVARYLSDLSAAHPELMEHVSGGGLLESLQMRALLTPGTPAEPRAADVATAGLAAVGIDGFDADASSALRDAMGTLGQEAARMAPATRRSAPAPRGLEDLLDRLDAVPTGVVVQQAAPGRWIAYLGAAPPSEPGTVRLVSVDRAGPARLVVRAIEEALRDAAADGPVHVMLVGRGEAGGTAAEIAAEPPDTFQVDLAITLSSPPSQVPDIPASTRMLCLESRSDPVSVLGSLVNAEADNRLMVVFDTPDESVPPHTAAGRALDASTHPRVLKELRRLRTLGYLAPEGPTDPEHPGGPDEPRS